MNFLKFMIYKLDSSFLSFYEPQLDVSFLDYLRERVMLENIFLQLLLDEDNFLFEVLDCLLAVLVVVAYQVLQTLVRVVVGHLVLLRLPELFVGSLDQIIDVLGCLQQFVSLFAVIFLMDVKLLIDFHKIRVDTLVLPTLFGYIGFDGVIEEIFLFRNISLDIFKRLLGVSFQLFEILFKLFSISLFSHLKFSQSLGMFLQVLVCSSRGLFMLTGQIANISVQIYKILLE